MLDPPSIGKKKIVAALSNHYGIAAEELHFLPLGYDSATWVFRVLSAEGQAYFLKLRTREGFSASSLAIPHYLREQGVTHIVTPLPLNDGRLWVALEDFVLSLYCFIDGHIGADIGLTEQHWRTFGALLKQIHACQLPPELLPLLPRESFVPNQRHLIPDLEAAVSNQTFANAEESELAAFWHSRRNKIWAVVNRVDRLGSQLRKTTAPNTLCHADMHTWNVLLDQDGHLWLIDWDEVVLALKERDLMFVVGGIGRNQVNSQETTIFLQGYGNPMIDEQALAYYRYAWAVQDMAAYGEQVFFLTERSAATRRAAVQGFKDMFMPGNIVDLALHR